MDHFKSTVPGLDAPASGLVEIIPDDTQDLAVTARALNVTTPGLVRVTTVDGSTGTVFVAAGIAFPVRARRVWATGTDASGIVGLY